MNLGNFMRTLQLGGRLWSVTALSLVTTAGVVLVAGRVTGNATSEPAAEKLGWVVPNLPLVDADGKPCSLDDWRDRRALALVFMSIRCPIGNRYIPVLKELQAKLKDRATQIVLVYGQKGDNREGV